MSADSLKDNVGSIVGYCIGYGIAISSTLFRLIHRRRRRQLWWDDWWALVALTTALYVLSFDIVKWSIGFESLSTRAKSFIIWTSLFSQSTVVWMSRMSISTTIVHLLPSGKSRTISKWGVGAIFFASVAGIISKLFWKGLPIPLLPVPPYVRFPVLFDIGVSLVATVWLIFWPAFIFKQMRLRRKVTGILLMAFGSAILLLGSEVVHSVTLMSNAYRFIIISGHIELFISVLSSNAVVLVASVYQRLRSGDDHRRDSTTSETPQQGIGITATPMTQFSSLVETLTELNTDDIHWSESNERSNLPETEGQAAESSSVKSNRRRTADLMP